MISICRDINTYKSLSLFTINNVADETGVVKVYAASRITRESRAEVDGDGKMNASKRL